MAAGSVFLSAFPFCQNAGEAGFSEVALVLFGSVAVGLLLFTAFSVLTHGPGKAALAASVLMLLVLNFSYVEQAIKLVLPNLKYCHTALVALAAALHIVGRMKRRKI